MVETSVFIKFDPEKILAVAVKLVNQHERLTRSIANIKRKSQNLTASWQGDSSNLYMDKINELSVQGEDMEKVLLAFSQDLMNVSGIYKAGETQAKQEAESLPTDGVFLV